MNIPSIQQIIVRITGIIALIEMSIMIVFANTSLNLGPYQEAILDTFLLAALSTPIIYLWIIKPYVVANEEVKSRISHMAHHDPLTQLANRRLLLDFMSKLSSCLVRYKSYGALLYIDLDGFKNINDSHGHDAGDAILIEISRRMVSLVRGEDIVSRVGGDEFVIALNQLDSHKTMAFKKAQLISERIQKSLSQTIEFRGLSLQVDTSIGLRLLAPRVECIETALKDADTAMFNAKSSGKGCIVAFEEPVGQSSTEEIAAHDMPVSEQHLKVVDGR